MRKLIGDVDLSNVGDGDMRNVEGCGRTEVSATPHPFPFIQRVKTARH